MSTINERLKVLIDSQHLNEYSFSRRINKSNTAVTKLVKGESKPGFDMLEAIFQEFPDLSREWFIEGKGEMWKQQESSSDDQAPADDYLRRHIGKLEDSFHKLSEQFTTELLVKNQQIAGMQRTIDALLLGKEEADSLATDSPEEEPTQPSPFIRVTKGWYSDERVGLFA